MRKLALTSAAVALALSVSGTANAAITLYSVVPGSASYSVPYGGTLFYDFDAPGLTPSYTGGGIVGPGTSSGLYAQPLGSTGKYYSVGPSTSTPGVIDLSFSGDLVLSFIWGSVDSYNTLEFVDSVGNVLASFTGNDIFNPATGDQTDPNTNPLVTFRFDATDTAQLAGMRLTSATNAFEIDNISAVPEPGTWAMMLLGFGAVGFAMRNRKRPQANIKAFA
jgi:hypothetical protein